MSPDVPWSTLLMNCARDSIFPGMTAKSPNWKDLAWADKDIDMLRDISKGFKTQAAGKMKLFSFYEDVPMPPQEACVSSSSQDLARGE